MDFCFSFFFSPKKLDHVYTLGLVYGIFSLNLRKTKECCHDGWIAFFRLDLKCIANIKQELSNYL